MIITTANFTCQVRFVYDNARTTCVLLWTLPDGTFRQVTGDALCSSKDNFCRAVGRKIALARSLNIAFEKPQRAVFWTHYWNERERICKKRWVA